MLLPLLLPAALAAEPPTEVQAHALAAGSALVYQPGDPGGTPMAGVVLDSARLQGVMRHDLDTGEHLGVMVQFEAANGPALLDAVATYAPNEAVAVDVGLQRTALSEMYDIILPNMPLRVRTAPESVAPARRTGAQVTLGARRGPGTQVRFGVWAPAGQFSTRIGAGIVSGIVEHRTEDDVVLHAGAWGTPGPRDPGPRAEAPEWGQGLDLAVGYAPDHTRLMAEVALQRDEDGRSSLGATLYGSHRTPGAAVEPAAFLDYTRWANGEGSSADSIGARGGARVHLVDGHAWWTTDAGLVLGLSGDDLLPAMSVGTRLMLAF